MNLRQFVQPKYDGAVKRLGLRIPLKLFELVAKCRKRDKNITMQRLVIRLLENYAEFHQKEIEERKAG